MKTPPRAWAGHADLRALTEPELEVYFTDRRTYPDAVVTDRAVLVPAAAYDRASLQATTRPPSSPGTLVLAVG